MASSYKSMVISLGKEPRKYRFEGPYLVNEWEPPRRAAVYAIMTRPDPQNRPNVYRVLYIGESSNLSERGFVRSHHKYKCFIRNAGSEDNLYIAIYLMPGSTEEDRREVEQYLISVYEPPCNAE